MATEHSKHQVESEERQDVVKDLTRVISLAYYYHWRDLLCNFTMTDLLSVCVLHTCTIGIDEVKNTFQLVHIMLNSILE